MMATARRGAALPPSVRKMLLDETAARLEALAAAIAAQAHGRRNRERARIDDILTALESQASEDNALAAEPNAAIYRTVSRLIILAVVENDPARCRQGIPLIRLLMALPQDRLCAAFE